MKTGPREVPASLREFHLIPDPIAAALVAGPSPLSAPTGVGALEQHPVVMLPNQPARLSQVSDGLPAPMLVGTDEAPDLPVIEPLWSVQPPRLAFLAAENGAVRVNGLAAPRLALLRDGDHVQWTADVVFQVAIFQRPRLGVPDADQVGKPCPVCTLPLAESTRVYVCAHCGTAMHCEEIEGGFECARLRAECTCGRPINFQAGYTRHPEWT